MMIRILLVFIFAVFAFACSRSPEKEITGVWKETGKTEVLEFQKGGTLNVKDGSESATGFYRFQKDGRLEIELKRATVPASPVIYSVSLNGGELVITDPAGLVMRYRRESLPH